MADLLYLDRVPVAIRSQFSIRIAQIAKDLSTDANWLMQVMKSESGLNPQAQNPTGGAVGLIQFMPATAAGLGTSSASLLAMNHVQQLEYVRKYFLPYRGRLNSYYDVYLVTFFPVAVGKPDSWVFQSSGLSAALIAKQNPGININKDQKITIAEFKEYLRRTVDTRYHDVIFSKKKF